MPSLRPSSGDLEILAVDRLPERLAVFEHSRMAA